MDSRFAYLLELPIAQRLELVEMLWDSIAATPDAVPMPQWQRDELDRRKADYEKHPESGVSWDEARKRSRGQDG
jgi:putative addiction module component (TIGR02574 family)